MGCMKGALKLEGEVPMIDCFWRNVTKLLNMYLYAGIYIVVVNCPSVARNSLDFVSHSPL